MMQNSGSSKKVHIDRYSFVFFAVVFVAPVIYSFAMLGRTSGLFFPPDEFGYWENVAKMLGLDWSGSTFMQSYYAKGYSLLLYLLARMFSSPLLMYKAALVVNALLFGAQAIVLFAFLKELQTDIDDRSLYLIATAGAFYPAHFVYMNYTIAETLICLLTILVFYFLAKYENTGRMIFALAAVISSVMLLFTHYRTVGVLLSAAFGIVAVQKKKTGKEIKVIRLAVVVTVIVLCVIAFAFLPLRSGYRYIDDQIDRFRSFFTAEGFWDIVMGTIGKLFYICVSTFGLFFLCITRIWKRRKECYTLVAFMASIVISIVIFAIFFVGGKGIDYLVYGRYTEVFAPSIICLGLSEVRDMMTGQTGGKGYGIVCSVIMAVAAVLLVIYAAIRGMNVYMNDFIIGLAWPFGRSNPKVNQLLGIPALLATVVLLGILWIARGSSLKKANDTKTDGRIADIVAVAFTVVFISIGVYMSEICVYHFHKLDRADVDLFKKVTAMYDDGRQVDFLRPPGVNYIGHMQFYMFDRNIRYIDGPDPEAFTTENEDVVVTYENYEFRDMLDEKYDQMDQSPHFIVYYNRDRSKKE